MSGVSNRENLYPTQEAAARALAQRLGYVMAPGGYLRDRGGAVVCRGWKAFTLAAAAAGDIARVDNGYALRQEQAPAPAPAPRTVAGILGRIITRGTPGARRLAEQLAANMIGTLRELCSLCGQGKADHHNGVIDPGGYGCYGGSGAGRAAAEDDPVLPDVPPLPTPEIGAAPGQEDQPDRGAPAPAPAALGGEDRPDDLGGREDEGEGAPIEVTYYPELAERARTLVSGAVAELRELGAAVCQAAPDLGAAALAVADAALLCGAAPAAASAGRCAAPGAAPRAAAARRFDLGAWRRRCANLGAARCARGSGARPASARPSTPPPAAPAPAAPHPASPARPGVTSRPRARGSDDARPACDASTGAPRRNPSSGARGGAGGAGGLELELDADALALARMAFQELLRRGMVPKSCTLQRWIADAVWERAQGVILSLAGVLGGDSFMPECRPVGVPGAPGNVRFCHLE